MFLFDAERTDKQALARALNFQRTHVHAVREADDVDRVISAFETEAIANDRHFEVSEVHCPSHSRAWVATISAGALSFVQAGSESMNCLP